MGSTAIATPMRPEPEDIEFVDGVSISRFSVDEYHEMIDRGFFIEDDNFELLDGHLVKKMARNPPHDSTIQKLDRRFKRMAPAGYQVRVQLGITLGDSEPEPDLAIVLGNETDFDAEHPSAEVIALVVEVSDFTLETDLERKAGIYARAKIPVYWVVNIPDRRIEIFTRPVGGKYEGHEIFPEGSAALVELNAKEYGTITVSEVLLTAG